MLLATLDTAQVATLCASAVTCGDFGSHKARLGELVSSIGAIVYILSLVETMLGDEGDSALCLLAQLDVLATSSVVLLDTIAATVLIGYHAYRQMHGAGHTVGKLQRKKGETGMK